MVGTWEARSTERGKRLPIEKKNSPKVQRVPSTARRPGTKKGGLLRGIRKKGRGGTCAWRSYGGKEL